ncbi:MAG: Stp1/IreP family PP2C-type Ser/Thr phosphatase [Simkaniaceae bacterium]|nr:Stp1/IreP family PP2C-type Ser/Thr phosphatase [Simkaniaceae bacterium]
MTDTGLVRRKNEDVFLNLKEHGFFAIADGMGGHNAGEVAANEAVRFVCASIEKLFRSSERNWTIFDLSSFNKVYIENANHWVHHLAKKKKDYKGMGTTICTLLFHECSLIYGHVGDSRIYRFRKGLLQQLTFDHSLKNEMIAQGQVKKENSQNFRYKNILTRAIGTQTDVEAEIHIAPVSPNDIYLMCSDGLTDQVSDKEITDILTTTRSIESATETLIKQAKQQGGHDNVTVVLIKTDEKDYLSR